MGGRAEGYREGRVAAVWSSVFTCITNGVGVNFIVFLYSYLRHVCVDKYDFRPNG